MNEFAGENVQREDMNDPSKIKIYFGFSIFQKTKY